MESLGIVFTNIIFGIVLSLFGILFLFSGIKTIRRCFIITQTFTKSVSEIIEMLVRNLVFWLGYHLFFGFFYFIFPNQQLMLSNVAWRFGEICALLPILLPLVYLTKCSSKKIIFELKDFLQTVLGALLLFGAVSCTFYPLKVLSNHLPIWLESLNLFIKKYNFTNAITNESLPFFDAAILCCILLFFLLMQSIVVHKNKREKE